MRKSTRILALVWVLVLLAPLAYAGHSFSNPMRTTGDGDFYALGGLDVDGTCMLDGAITFNAGMTGDDLTLSGTLAVGGAMSLTDSLYIDGPLTITGALAGARVWLNMAIANVDQTVDKSFGGTRNSSLDATQGVPVTTAGCVKGYAVRYNIDSFSAGAYAVTRFYIDGVKTFADSLYVTGTGMQERPGSFARGTYTFTAGEQLYAEFDIEGTIQYDKPYLTWDLQLDD